MDGGVVETHQAIKTVMKWTGAKERTVKNWFAGSNGTNGHHLAALGPRTPILPIPDRGGRINARGSLNFVYD